jgi:prepilin-type processing-associated H-X9-DG protein
VTERAATPRTSVLAVVSLVVGLLALAPCLLIVAGLPALLLGFYSLRQINRSDGRLRGQGLAVAAMALGALGSFGSLLGLGALVVLNLQETSNRVGCQNNYRLIGHGVNNYHDVQRHFPPATVAHPDLPPDRRLSWLVAVLPYLEAEPAEKRRASVYQAVYERVELKESWDDEANRKAAHTALRAYLCPSLASWPLPNNPAPTTYVGVAGVGPGAAELPPDDPRAGFFGYDRRLTRDELQRRRGDGQTLIVAETAERLGPWAAGGFPTCRGLDPAQRPYLGVGRPFGGLHPGGLQALFADGSVLFLRDSLEPDKLEALVTLAAPGEPPAPDP